MKTLVIHPDDRTTDFLNVIYKDKDWTVITDRGEILKSFEQIKSHDRIIMMGHGSPYGLLGFQNMFMNSEFIKVLQTKDCVCIWCNADQYVLRENIKGFYTGMFISEVSEARYFDIDVDQETVDFSNMLFVNLMKDVIDSPTLITEIKRDYYSDTNPVIHYNNQRLYYRDEESILSKKDLDDEFLMSL